MLKANDSSLRERFPRVHLWGVRSDRAAATGKLCVADEVRAWAAGEVCKGRQGDAYLLFVDVCSEFVLVVLAVCEEI
jgi:hypothetical protein